MWWAEKCPINMTPPPCFDACLVRTGIISCPPGSCAVVTLVRMGVKDDTPKPLEHPGEEALADTCDRWTSIFQRTSSDGWEYFNAREISFKSGQRNGESAAFLIYTNGIRLAGVKKGSYIIRSKHWETDELHFDSSYFAPFEHATCMQMTPFLSAFGEKEKSYLHLLMPFSGGRSICWGGEEGTQFK